MDPREYHDARWFSLLRAAEDLGVPEEEAPAVVRRVLDANERRIRRSEDPDPLVHESLRDAVLGEPRGRARRPWRRVAGVAVLLLVVGGLVLATGPDERPLDHLRSDQVPSLFGYDAARAERLLRDRGLRVTVLPFRACEVMDRVVGSDPPAGTPYERGDRITVFRAVPQDIVCLSDYDDRATAWKLLDLANGRGPGPEFARRVFVYAGGAPAVVLDGDRARDPDAWRATGVLAALRRASARVTRVSEHPLQYAVPAIRVIGADEDLGACGVPEPTVAGHEQAFSVVVRPPDGRGCGVRVDLYRERASATAPVDGVVLYPALS
jgi:hypothetical protein